MKEKKIMMNIKRKYFKNHVHLNHRLIEVIVTLKEI